jgi:hypothetical protein
MEYRTVEGVELVQVGMDWPAVSGSETFTFENLADAVEAANEDPHIQLPRIKLGHQSEINGAVENFNPFEALGDAEPSFGRVSNLRLENDGAVLVGDFIEVPDWLAESLPSAYPNRSIEARRLVETEGGKRYSMVLTAVALLGAALPACTSLEDLERFLLEGPSGVAAATNPNPEEGRMTTEIAASVDTATIRERFNFGWAMDPDNGAEQDTYWWWAISVRVDPAEIIADDDEGNLWSVPFSTDGKDEITFGEPVKVRQEFVPIEASAEGVAAAYRQRTNQKVLASNLERPEKQAPGTTAASRPESEEDTMDPKEIRERLGLAEDATDEECFAKLDELKAAEGEGEAAPEGEPSGGTEGEGAPEGDPAEPVAAGAALPEGMVAVPADKWAEVQAGAKAGGELASTTEIAKRDSTIEAALKDGKIANDARASMEALHANTETRAHFYTLLTADVKDGGLAKGLVPVDELGVAAETSESDMERVMASFPGHKPKQAA